MQPSTIVRQGLGYVPQRENVFETLSVDENLEIGLKPRRDLPLPAAAGGHVRAVSRGCANGAARRRAAFRAASARCSPWRAR